jgi:hypothetical protein
MDQKYFYSNGYGISIISNEFSYGGLNGLYEIAILIGEEEEYEICYETPITNDVMGYLNPEQVIQTIEDVKKLPPTTIKNRDIKINDLLNDKS